MSRREIWKKAGLASVPALFSACTAPSAENGEFDYTTLEEGDSYKRSIEVERINENETARISLVSGSHQTYEEGEELLCIKGDEESGLYLDDIDPEAKQVTIREEPKC
ncbi:MAG: hypothetical protein ABEJ56_02885 [Candidatus Nanohaloarchaea archaeon]